MTETVVRHTDRVCSEVGAVVVNYNSGKDTLVCLASLLRGRRVPRWIVVIDNQSPDGSGRLILESLQQQQRQPARELFGATLPKPCTGESECWHDALRYTVEFEPMTQPHRQQASSAPITITFIGANRNRGFAAGNNLGIAWLRAHTKAKYAWLVNADAAAMPSCLAVVQSAIKLNLLGPLAGTLLVDFDEAHRVQAAGGSLSWPWLSPKHHAASQHVDALIGPVKGVDGSTPSPRLIKAQYPVGASMLLALDRQINLDERLFLYYEEPMLAHDLGLAESPIVVNAVVAHRGGGSTQGHQTYSALRDLHATRSRTIFAHAKGRMASMAVAVFCAALAIRRLQQSGLQAAHVVWLGWHEGRRKCLTHRR